MRVIYYALCLAFCTTAHSLRVKQLVNELVEDHPKPHSSESVLETNSELNATVLHSSTPMYFDIGTCLSLYPVLLPLAYQGQQVCKHAFSCVGAWSVDISMQLITGTYCWVNAYDNNVPLMVRDPLNKAYGQVLRNVAVPWLEYLGHQASMDPKMRNYPFSVAQRNYVPSANKWASFLSYDDCNDEKLVKDSTKCMITRMRELLQIIEENKPDWSKISMSEEDAAVSQSKLHKLYSSLLEVQEVHQGTEVRRRALEQDQGPGKVTAGGFQLTPDDDIPLPGPIPDMYPGSLINPPSVSRYSHAVTGLPMWANKLTDHIKEAKCNDGSPGLYYLSKGSLDKYHFHVAGGYFCNNPRNCRKRIKGSPMLASTKGYEPLYHGSGIFDPVNGGLEGWTHTYLPYCSSDAWFGQVELDFEVVSNTVVDKATGARGTHFRGYTMMDAMLLAYAKMGLGKRPGQELIVSSCSAGSIGVSAQADSFLPRLRKLFEAQYPGVQYYEPKTIIILDNMPVISPKPIASNFNGNVSLFDQSQELVDMLYVKPKLMHKVDFLSASCVAENGANPAACVFPSHSSLHIKLPNLILNNLQDSFLLFNPHAMGVPANPEQERIMYQVDADLREYVYKVRPQQNQWAIGCNDHCLALFQAWWRMVPVTDKHGMEHVSSKDMMIMTMKGDTGKIAMDECKTYNCGCAGSGPWYFLTALKFHATAAAFNANPYANAQNEKLYDEILRLPQDSGAPRYPVKGIPGAATLAAAAAGAAEDDYAPG